MKTTGCMNKQYLISNQTALQLYEYAGALPIIDYHNHLSVADIQSDRRFTDIYTLWIEPDPYKHRAMRMCGVEEKYITGDAEPIEKFTKWCETLPKLPGNPLYIWSVMELEQVFGLSVDLHSLDPEELYTQCNSYLAQNSVTACGLLKAFHVEYVSPCMSLLEEPVCCGNAPIAVPSLRGDDITAVTKPFLEKLAALTHTEITDLSSLEAAIRKRLDRFQASGCRFSDHALDTGFLYYEDDGNNPKRFGALLDGTASAEDRKLLSSYILTFLGKEYAARRMILQLHMGAHRYTSTKLRQKAGPFGGFAGIGTNMDISSLTRFLDTLDCSPHGLPKTILFPLNPADNASVSVLSGSFSRDGMAGLITQGPAWWWCDHISGIRDVLETTATFGVLQNFPGMTTDSRSFLSFVRHDYFRRILCSWLGEKLENKEWVCSVENVRELIYQVCYGNAHTAIQEGGNSI